jgi:GR25 family glycosyltransferase involved in LPS biosynthesis
MDPNPILQPASTGARLWDGYFINLDRAVERRRRMEEQIGRFGGAGHYRRSTAVDGRALNRPSTCSPGEVGIFRSHLNVLRRIASGRYPGHVMEDDVLLCDLTAPTIESLIRRSVVDQFDIVFLETYVGTMVPNIARFSSAFREATRNGPVRSPDQLQILDLGKDYLYGATSYVASPNGARKLVALLGPEWERGPRLPIDDTIQRATHAGNLRVGCTFPFVTTIDLETSSESNAGRDEAPDLSMLQRFIRYTFFVRRDIDGYATSMLDRVLARLPKYEQDEAIDFYIKILSYRLTVPPQPPKR